MSESTERNISQIDVQPGGKRAYNKPEFRFENVFETRALSCGKISGSNASACHITRKTS